MDNYDDEDEFDHEHDMDSDEEHIEMHRRMNRVEKKFKAFLEDIADDMMEPELVERIQKKIQKKLSASSVPMTLSTLKAFAEGFEFGMSSTMKLEGNVAQLFVGVKKVVKDREAKKPRIEVDITKSKLLPPPEEGAQSQ